MSTIIGTKGSNLNITNFHTEIIRRSRRNSINREKKIGKKGRKLSNWKRKSRFSREMWRKRGWIKRILIFGKLAILEELREIETAKRIIG